LEDDASATQQKMNAANALLNALADEEARWTLQSKEFDVTISRLSGKLSFVSFRSTVILLLVLVHAC
jgi:dynein heavy chain, axonemal